MKTFDVKTLELQREQFHAAFLHVPELDAEVEYVHCLKAWRTTLTRDVFGHRQPDAVFYVPASWWQHFKRECFPERLLRRFPVEYAEIRKRVTALYPTLNVAGGRHHARIYIYDTN